MTFDEKVFIGVAAAAITAIILFRHKDTAVVSDMSGDGMPATDYVGLSQTPENSSMTEGPMYGMHNQRYAFWPPVNNFLPTISSGQGGQVVEQPMEFVRRWAGTIFGNQENG